LTHDLKIAGRQLPERIEVGCDRVVDQVPLPPQVLGAGRARDPRPAASEATANLLERHAISAQARSGAQPTTLMMP
jgi:hypothetical protein